MSDKRDSGVITTDNIIQKVVPSDPKPQWQKSMSAQQRSRWVAFLADNEKMEEESHDWTIVPKDRMLALGLVVPKMSIIVPKVNNELPTFELTDRKGLGTILDKNGNCMYVEAEPTRGVALFKVGHISKLQAKLYNMRDIKLDGGNALAIDLPGNLFLIPSGNRTFAFIQYKDGVREVIGQRDVMMGQVIGAIVDKFGNYIYAYHDNKEFTVIIGMDNIFSSTCKISMSVQGIDKTKYTNPFKGRFGDAAKIINFPSSNYLQ